MFQCQLTEFADINPESGAGVAQIMAGSKYRISLWQTVHRNAQNSAQTTDAGSGSFLIKHLHINSIQRRPPCEADSYSANQESPCLLWKSNIHYRVWNNLSLEPILSLTRYFLKIHMHIIHKSRKCLGNLSTCTAGPEAVRTGSEPLPLLQPAVLSEQCSTFSLDNVLLRRSTNCQYRDIQSVPFKIQPNNNHLLRYKN